MQMLQNTASFAMAVDPNRFIQMLPEQKIKMVPRSVHHRHLVQFTYFVFCHQVIGPIEHDEYGIIIVFAHGVIHCLSQYLVLSILRWRRVLGMAMLHRFEHRDCVTWKGREYGLNGVHTKMSILSKILTAGCATVHRCR